MLEVEKILNKVHQGDCLEFMRQMPSESVDLIVTDPPYNMGYSGRGKQNFDGFSNDNIPEEEHTVWFDDIVAQMARILKNDSAVYIYIDFRNYARFFNVVRKYFDIKNCIVWDKQSIGMGASYRFQHEFCIYAVKGKPELYFDKKNVSDVWELKRDTTGDYVHPTQKPVSAMHLPIKYSSKEGG